MSMSEKIQELFVRLASETSHMQMPGFSVGILDNLTTEPWFYNFGTWFGKGSPVVTEDTVYDLASISKLYTAAVILRLHQQKKLDVDDRCSVYLNVFDDSNVTIHDLLTHKADFKTRFGAIRAQYGVDIGDAIFAIQPPMDTSPNRLYQNATYTYLGRIIESVTNRSLADNFEEFFRSFGLNETYLGLVGQNRFTSPPTEMLADGTIVQAVTHDETARLLGGLAGHAGVFASNRDLLRFGRLWLDDRLMTEPGLFERVFRNYSADAEYAQGLGWQNRPSYLPHYNPAIFHQPGFTGGSLIVNIKMQIVCSFVCNRGYAGRDNNDHKKLRQIVFEYMDKI